MAEPRRHSERGPAGDQVAQNLARVRSACRLTTTELAEAVTKLGVQMTASTVTKIERQGRRVTVDELVALAAALDVSPVALMLPARDPGGPVRLTEGFTARTWRDAWHWMHGKRPLIASAGVATAAGSGGLPWMATNQPYLTEEDLGQLSPFTQPPGVSIELLEEAAGEDGDDGPSD